MTSKTRKRPAKGSTSAKRAATREDDGPDAAPTFSGPEQVYAFAATLTEEANAREEQRREQRLETWVTFQVAGETMAFPVEAVKEVLRVEAVTRVPHAPAVVRGIINVRGRVVPLVDLRARLGLPIIEITSKSRVVMTTFRDRLFGLLVDAVDRIVRIDAASFKPLPDDVMTAQSEYIVGVSQERDSLLVLLNIEPILLIPDAIRPAF